MLNGLRLACATKMLTKVSSLAYADLVVSNIMKHRVLVCSGLHNVLMASHVASVTN